MEELKFEEAFGELEKIVRQLESGKIPLDEAIKAYERGNELKNICTKRLQEAQLVVDKLLIENGEIKGKEPL